MQRYVDNAKIREQRKTEDIRFYVETQFGKNHGEEGDNSLFSRGYSELSRAHTLFTVSDFCIVFA